MDRRAFILGAAGLAALPKRPNAQGIQRASVEHPDIVKQECAEWCWAASASMIFANLGHPVDQRRIVAAVYHELVCAPGQTLAITEVLNVPWIDDNDQQFQPQVEAGYDQIQNIVNITNNFILSELEQDRLLLYANTHHCMVVSEVDYFATPSGPNIINVTVLDPWPASPDVHPLSAPEMVPVFAGGQMMYLAAVRV
jgi:Papain-like cysteine protease AvrRpt2